jgi:hypothetical protein
MLGGKQWLMVTTTQEAMQKMIVNRFKKHNLEDSNYINKHTKRYSDSN